MKTTKQGTPYSITKKGMAYVYEIEGKGFGGYALTHVSKRKLSESEIDEIGSGNEYKNGGGVGSSQNEFTYSVIIKPKSEQYYGAQFKSYAGSKELILADREKLSNDFDFDKNDEGFKKLLKNYADKCSVDLEVYDSQKMQFPKNFKLNLSEQIDIEVNEILESLYYVEVTNKDNTSLYIYNEFRNEITTDTKKSVEKIKSNLPIEDSYDITIRVIRMKDGKIVDTQKVLKKDKLPRIMVDWNNVKRVATIVEEEGNRFDVKYKDIIAFIREELDTPQVIKSRIKMLEGVNIKEEAKDNIAKNLPIAIKLKYYLTYKMNYKDGNFDIVRGFKNGGGVGNYEKFGKDNARLVKFNIDNLDDFESMQYDHLINSMDKASALQILINNAEGDYSQLSKELSEIAEEQYPSNDLYEDNREYAKGGKIKRSKESIIADSRYKALPEGRRKSKKYAIIELADGTKIRRRNANQTGDVEGGRYYSEKRPSHTDKEGKAIVSVRKKVTKKAIKKSISVSKPSDSIKFVGINFKRYDYTVGGL